MLKATLKSLFAHKGRLALTVLSIVLGVAFVTGTYVYTDTTNRAFDDIFTSAYEGVDIHVSGDSPLSFGQGVFFDRSVADDVAAVEGVAAAEPALFVNGAQVLDREGEPLGVPGAPRLGVGIDPTVPQVGSGLQMRVGRLPASPDEVALDVVTADNGGYAVGDSVPVAAPTAPRAEYTLVGTVGFGEADNVGGASLAVFEMGVAQELAGRPGAITEINVGLEPGADLDTVIAAIAAVVPADVAVESAQSAAEEQAAEIQEGLSFFTSFLLVFAFVALFVGTFIIYNTFQVVIAQRMRELALMRAIGSTRGQVLRTVLLEAVIVGAVASLLGIVVGIGLAVGMRAGLSAFGLSLPGTGLVVAPRTVLLGLAVGIGVTLVSAMVPAVAASRIPPVAALGVEGVAPRRRSLTARAVIGTVVLAVGAAMVLGGLRDGSGNTALALSAVGGGAVVMILGVYVLSALVARPVAAVLGAPFAGAFGVAGKLAQRNAGRSPRRTAATSAAIMVGTALITLVLIMSASLRSAVDEVFATGIDAEVTVTSSDQFSLTGFPRQLGDEIATLPEVAGITRIAAGFALVDGTETFVGGLDPNFADFFEAEVVEGTATLAPGSILIVPPVAENLGWSVGDSVEVVFEQTGPRQFTVAGIIDSDALGGPMISREDFTANFAIDADSQLYVKLVDGVTPEQGRDLVAAAASDFPGATVQTADELVASISDQVNQLLALITALLGLAVLVAFLGVTNTMALAVMERTREIGLLRAVGLNRLQTRTMIWFESSIVSAFGALLGVTLGLFCGWALIGALAAEGLESFVVPVPWLVGGVVTTAVLGIVFALWPARRAARLDVLEAIAYE